ncbi:putative U-box domain-containing protein 39 [Cocos nucifera]|uniref:Putative U-box domain-containing protein 39 n=1 Tax=Cocos nucifera TaxID=13894 RepID=A0A8K0IY75_COCNU|nr:putative U-box domain-containing protein 39 [Cocos nucifera]
MALYHLSLTGTNQSKITRTIGAIRALLAMAAEEEGAPAGAVAGKVVGDDGAVQPGGECGGAAGADGRGGGGADKRGGSADRGVLHGGIVRMSRGSLRFRMLVRAVGAEKVLMRVVEAESSSEVKRDGKANSGR